MNKIVNILKPTGMTSHDVVSKVRKILNTKKVGHTGTLDPDAAGVLPICIGKATKVSDFILNKDKSYIGELTLGIITDTYDSSGVVISQKDTSSVTKEDIYKAFELQLGVIMQKPPVYSALKVNGKKMYEIAREGKSDEIEIKSREVHIKELKVLSINNNKIRFYVKCSKGTYIRSMCYDIGEIIGCGGHMSFLMRTSSGKFNLENSITLEELEEYFNKGTLDKYLYDIDFVLQNFGYINIKPMAVKSYINGAIVYPKGFLDSCIKDEELVRVYSENEFLGVGKLIDIDNKKCLKSNKLFI